MGDVDGVAEAALAHRDATDVTIADGKNGLTLHPVGLHVDAAMKMMRSGLTKITRQ